MEASPRIPRHHLAILVLITALGAALRLFRLDAQSTWYDEAFSVAHSARGLDQLFTVLIDDYVHPPLHYLVLHYWFDIVGSGAWQARLISAIFGTLSIPLLYRLARRFTDSSTSLCAAFLLAISQLSIYYSQEARPYMQTQFLSLTAALSFLAFLDKPNLARSAWFTACALALVYTHYYGAGTLLALGIYWLIFRREYSPQVLPRLAMIVIIIVLGFAPWLLAVRANVKVRAAMTADAAAPSTGRVLLAGTLNGVNRFNNAKFRSIDAPTTVAQALSGIVLFTLPAVAAFGLGIRRRSRGEVLSSLTVLIPFAMAAAAGAAGMIFSYRHYSFAVPGYFLLIALGWRLCLPVPALRWGWLAVASAVTGIALQAIYTAPTKPDYRAAFLPLARAYQSGDCVSNRPQIFRYRMHLAWEVYHPALHLRLVELHVPPVVPVECARLWLVWDKTPWMNSDAVTKRQDGEAERQLREQFTSAAFYPHPAVHLELFIRRRP